MEIRELRSLLALAESGSITKVGELLHLTPAAVHKQLKSLECEIGVQLYERFGRQLRLTAHGRAILPHVRELMVHYEAALSSIRDFEEALGGVLRVGAGPSISSTLLPAMLIEFRRLHPKVDFQVETGASSLLLSLLENGGIDLAMVVTSGQLPDEAVAVEASWDFEIAAVRRPGLGRPIRTLRQAKDEPFVLYRAGARIENIIDAFFVSRKYKPRVVMRSDNTESLRAMALAGLGIAMLPYWVVEGDLQTKRLSRLLQGESPIAGQVSLLRRAGRYLSPATRAFLGLARNFDFVEPALQAPRARPARVSSSTHHTVSNTQPEQIDGRLRAADRLPLTRRGQCS